MVVERTYPSVLTIGSIFIYPGMNTFPDTVGQWLSTHPLFNEQIKIGRIRVIQAAKAPDKKADDKMSPPPMGDDPAKNQDLESAKAIVALTTQPALKVVSNTLNTEVLKLVIQLDSRKTIKAAARKQFDTIIGKSAQ